MKTIFIISFCISQLVISAQNEYFLNSPKWGMIEEHQWAQFAPVFGTKTTYFVLGDTLLNGALFVKIFQEGISYAEGANDNGTGNGLFTETPYVNPVPIAFLRSQNENMFKWNSESNIEELLYHFDVAVGDVFPISASIINEELFVVDISTIFLGGIERKVISTTNADGIEVFPKIIEGVGSSYGPWHSGEPQLDFSIMFQCFSINDISYQVDANENPWLTSSTSICEFVVDILEIQAPPSLFIYPNPVSSEVFIKSEIPILKIVIRDLIGSILIEDSEGKKNFQLDLSLIPPGMYICELTFVNRQRTTSPIVKF